MSINRVPNNMLAMAHEMCSQNLLLGHWNMFMYCCHKLMLAGREEGFSCLAKLFLSRVDDGVIDTYMDSLDLIACCYVWFLKKKLCVVS